MKLFTIDSETEEALITSILAKYNHLKRLRETTMDKCVLASKLVAHRTSSEANSVWNNDYPILNTLPKKAIKTVVNGLMGYVMSPSLVWFRFNSINKKFYPTDRLYGANDYLERCQQALLYVFSATSYY